MKQLLCSLLGLLAATCVNAITYYDAMYVPAGGESTDYVPATAASEVPEEVSEPASEQPDQPDDASLKETLVAATLPVKVTHDTYMREDGSQVRETYHVVVGSFSSKVNAMRMADGLRAAGSRPTIAMSNQGLYRVFLVSGDDESAIRQWLARSRTDYPDAWILKIKAE